MHNMLTKKCKRCRLFDQAAIVEHLRISGQRFFGWLHIEDWLSGSDDSTG